MATEILVMQPLHDDDNSAFVLIVEPWDDFGIEPLVDRATARLIVHTRRRDRIVDDNEVGATPDQDAANHARDSLPAMGEIKVAAAALGLQMRKQGPATLRLAAVPQSRARSHRRARASQRST